MSLCHGQAVVSFVQQSRSIYFCSCEGMDETEVGVAVLTDFISLTTDEQPDGSTREHAQRSATRRVCVTAKNRKRCLIVRVSTWLSSLVNKKSSFYKSRVIMSCLHDSFQPLGIVSDKRKINCPFFSFLQILSLCFTREGRIVWLVPHPVLSLK